MKKEWRKYLTSYNANSIKELSFLQGVRQKIQMYLGSDDIEGTYQAFKEILNNSTDEAIVGYGDKLDIIVDEKENSISIRDYGRGCPFLVKLMDTDIEGCREFLFVNVNFSKLNN